MTSNTRVTAAGRELAVSLDGWLLDSGQIDAVVTGQRLSFALEVGSIRRLIDTNPSTSTTPGLLDLQVSAAVRKMGPRTTILDVGFPAHVATELVEEVLTADEMHISTTDAAIDVVISLGVDPYTGRTRPEPVPPDLVLPWVVMDIRRKDVDDGEFRPVSTTLPHSATTTYALLVVLDE